MTTRLKPIALEWLGGLFDLIWIGASIVLVYFLYGALTKNALWPYLSWSLVVGIFAKQIAAALKNKKKQVDYVDQLTERGYEQADAEAAWRIATGGGTNLLRNLQQAEIGDEVNRDESQPDPDKSDGFKPYDTAVLGKK